MGNEKSQGIQVDGFLFQDRALAEKAQRELAGIRYIKGKTNMSRPKMVLQVYDKIIEQKLCETPIGIGYLRDLQEYLQTNPSIDKAAIQPIPIEEIIRQDFVSTKEQEESKRSAGFWISLAGNLILLLLVVGMFAITLSSKLPTILDYKEKLLDEYASWEQELNQRERAVQAKERELGIEP